MQLTFQDLLLLRFLLSSDFDIEHFSPARFYSLTNGNTSFTYTDAYLFAKSLAIKKISRKQEDFSTLLNLKIYIDIFFNKSDIVTTDTIEVAKHKASKHFKEDFLESTVLDVLYIKDFTTNRLHRLIDNAKELFRNHFVHSIAKKCIPESIGYGEQEYGKIIQKLHSREGFFVKNTVTELVKYENMFDVFAISNCTDISSRHLLPGNVAGAYFKSCVVDNQKSWKLIPTIGVEGRERFNRNQPFLGFFIELLSGNVDYTTRNFPQPVFKNNKFSHFVKSEKHSFQAANGNGADYMATLLESRGYTVKRNETGAVDFAELAIKAWGIMEKNEKLNIIKASTANVCTEFIGKLLKYNTMNKVSERSLIPMRRNNVRSTLAAIIGACKGLSNLYIAETDFQIKTVIESQILALRSIVKREITGTILNDIFAQVQENDRNNFIKKFNFFCNDDNYPQRFLKNVGVTKTVVENSKKFAMQCVALSSEIDYAHKKKIIRDECGRLGKEITHLERSAVTRFFNSKKISMLKTQFDNYKPAIEMMRSIYDDNGVLKNGDDTLLKTWATVISSGDDIVPEYDIEYVRRHSMEDAGIQSGLFVTKSESQVKKAFYQHNEFARKNKREKLPTFDENCELIVPPTVDTNTSAQQNTPVAPRNVDIQVDNTN